MLTYMIVVNDAGELKPVSMQELHGVLGRPEIENEIEVALNAILDQRAIAVGEYDPSDNDTPMVFRGPPPHMEEEDFEHDDAIVERLHDEHDLTR